MGWTVRGSNPGGSDIFRPRGLPSFLKIDTAFLTHTLLSERHGNHSLPTGAGLRGNFMHLYILCLTSCLCFGNVSVKRSIIMPLSVLNRFSALFNNVSYSNRIKSGLNSFTLVIYTCTKRPSF